MPIGFNQNESVYKFGQFGDAVIEITADPSDANNQVLKMTRSTDTDW